jgi:prepilin-type N-terminal cleavage/methylation domain-containing protein
VGQTGQFRRGFTLTEILMAIAILGIGLTMVASVFPVAVDQSRRSRESTMAALCARSVMATMRAKRDVIVGQLRMPANNAINKTVEISLNWYLAGKDRVYNPDSFLYEQDRSYKTTDSGSDAYPNWLAGNYYPVVLATPIANTGIGPWRITILIYKATGAIPAYLNNLSATKVGLSWSQTGGQPGGYIVDWRPGDAINNYGQAYLVDRLIPGATRANDSIYLASPSYSASSATFITHYVADRTIKGMGAATTDLPQWVTMPGAIAAYHTIFGE